MTSTPRLASIGVIWAAEPRGGRRLEKTRYGGRDLRGGYGGGRALGTTRFAQLPRRYQLHANNCSLRSRTVRDRTRRYRGRRMPGTHSSRRCIGLVRCSWAMRMPNPFGWSYEKDCENPGISRGKTSFSISGRRKPAGAAVSRITAAQRCRSGADSRAVSEWCAISACPPTTRSTAAAPAPMDMHHHFDHHMWG